MLTVLGETAPTLDDLVLDPSLEEVWINGPDQVFVAEGGVSRAVSMSLASIQGATLAAQGASDQAARVFVQQPGLAEASSRAETAAVVALRNHGVDSVARLERFCEPSPCLSPGSAVTIRVSVEAPLFTSSVLPGVLGAETVTVSAESTRIVSRYGVPR